MPVGECKRTASWMHAFRYGRSFRSSVGPGRPPGDRVLSSSSRSFLSGPGLMESAWMVAVIAFDVASVPAMLCDQISGETKRK
jgi:hypothetical protein